jgi:hypothetical protein
MKTIINENGKPEGYEIKLTPIDKSAMNLIVKEHADLTLCLEELDNWIMSLKEVQEETLSKDAQVEVANILEKHNCYNLVRNLSD